MITYEQDRTHGHREWARATFAAVRMENPPAPVVAESRSDSRAWIVDCLSCGIFEHIGTSPTRCPNCDSTAIDIAEN